MVNYAIHDLNMQILNYRFTPKLIPTLATLLLLPILINLGLWQSNKADKKQLMQDIYESKSIASPVQIGAEPVNVTLLRYRKVIARGRYEPVYSIFIDNQVYKGRAGYFVITPLHISGTDMRILVNRGWVPTGTDRRVLPVIETPQIEVEVTGEANDNSGKYIELNQIDSQDFAWQKVWQNLDLKRYQRVVPFAIQPVTIRLDPDSASGGYVRDWPKPDSKIEVNRGYAIQWYLMSIALVIIYIVTNFKKVSPEV